MQEKRVFNFIGSNVWSLFAPTPRLVVKSCIGSGVQDGTRNKKVGAVSLHLDKELHISYIMSVTYFDHVTLTKVEQ